MKKILFILDSIESNNNFQSKSSFFSSLMSSYEIYIIVAKSDKLILFTFNNDRFNLVQEYSCDPYDINNFQDYSRKQIYSDILNEFQIDFIHILNFYNNSFDLFTIANSFSIPIVLSISDFFFICPHNLLIEDELKLCNGICNENDSCIPNYSSNNNDFIDIWREFVSKIFDFVDYFVFDSVFTQNMFFSIFPNIKKQHFKVIEHTLNLPRLHKIYSSVPNSYDPIKILSFVDSSQKCTIEINTIKQIINIDSNSKLEFYFLTKDNFGEIQELSDFCNVNVYNYSSESDILEFIRMISPSFIGIFGLNINLSIFPLLYAKFSSVPIIINELNFYSKKVNDIGGGWNIDFSNIENAYNKILDISNFPEKFDIVQNNLYISEFKNIENWVSEYLPIYDLITNSVYPNYKIIYNFMNSDSPDITTKFDCEWYCDNYFVDSNVIDPILHYLIKGVGEGCNPNDYFDSYLYMDEYEIYDENPFVHYLTNDFEYDPLIKLFDLPEVFSLDLKRTLRGRKGFYFLINDSNFELNQHFEEGFISEFDYDTFKDQFSFKKRLFSSKGINYGYFVVPDKSVVCKELLPFKYDDVYRIIDSIDEIPDFSIYLNSSDYFKLDSHMNFKGGKYLSYLILNSLGFSLQMDEWNQIIENSSSIIEIDESHDLLYERNWSYSIQERDLLNIMKCKMLISKNTKNLKHEIPKQFFKYNNRMSRWYLNDSAYSDLKVLIFHDSTINLMSNYFAMYFKEIFFYWDHGSMNEDLIKWFKPDLILEIRVERFLYNLPTPDWVINKENFFDDE